MNNLYPYKPSKTRPTVPKPLPAFSGTRLRRPENYLPDAGLVDAVNVSLMLRQPLMVTGEPGTGKTVLGASVAWELGLDSPLMFETKSTTTARDLFYIYDTLGRFMAKELRADPGKASDYITFNALGASIVLANERDNVADILPQGFIHPGKRRSVVVIDEVEKAPRDFPNDILNEIERMYFRIPELGNREVAAEEDAYPIVIMTNNSEKSLPDAFLRRCIYYNIPFPSSERLQEIVLVRMPEFAATAPGSALLKETVAFVLLIREESVGMEKKPGTSELLNWLNAMAALGASPSVSLREQKPIAQRCLPALAKISGDLERVQYALSSWTESLVP